MRRLLAPLEYDIMVYDRVWDGRLVRVLALAAAVLVLAGCSSDDGATKQEADSLRNFDGPRRTTSEEDGFIVESFTLDSEDKPDVVKYFEEYPDPDDESVIKRRLRKKEVDVNADGTMNIVRLYDKQGVVTREKLDTNLDNNYDTINYFDHGELVRKEVLSADASRVVETRFYSKGTIVRVERDLNQDGQTDYWEYYEEGTLDRTGRDLTADGRADTWRRR
jgi:hypothetical protein